MKLYYYQGFSNVKNFGDELNSLVWDNYLPGLLKEESDGTIFIGIGTLLNDKIPDSCKTIIMGAGVGYGKLPSSKVVNHWKIYCLRGKLSADKLNVSHQLVASDPAILLHKIKRNRDEKKYAVSYMPHWMNMGGSWNIICKNIGFNLLNPLSDKNKIIRDIASSELVITEAMHGAIVSDALRTPWIAVHSNFGDHFPFKWMDWSSSLGLKYESNKIIRLWHAEDFQPDLLCKVKRMLNPVKMEVISKRLLRIASTIPPSLSNEHSLHNAIEKLESAIHRFKVDEHIV
jgi:succinoglycan biosynthesis protein ExoV